MFEDGTSVLCVFAAAVVGAIVGLAFAVGYIVGKLLL